MEIQTMRASLIGNGLDRGKGREFTIFITVRAAAISISLLPCGLTVFSLLLNLIIGTRRMSLRGGCLFLQNLARQSRWISLSGLPPHVTPQIPSIWLWNTRAP